MITNKDINEEITSIDKLVEDKVIKDAYQVASIKLASLTLKLLMSMRTNQTLTMDKLGVKKIAPVKRDNVEVKEQ
jgi:hypothetical protein